MPASAQPYRLINDLVVIGCGAAGLTAAIWTGRRAPGLKITCVDGARHIGAKILVSGGSRCNVTNRTVTERDFWGGSSRLVRNVLRAFPAARAAAFFEELGVALHEEEDGKLFPDTNRSRTVLNALLAECAGRGVAIEAGSRVVDVTHDDLFRVRLADTREIRARAVVLATGGQSLPKTGSDGFGYQLAQRFGHSIVATSPALAPLLLESDLHASLSGVSHHCEASLHVRSQRRLTLRGDWLWTHFGASGPLALNLSRHWHRAELDGESPELYLNVLPGERFETLDSWLIEQARVRPRAHVSNVLASRVPAALAPRWLDVAAVAPDTPLAQVAREERRHLVHALLATPLAIRGSRGYQYAEATAGGVSLDEVDSATLESRRCPGLYLAGEILDVDGRLGGFNFQWAWSSGFVAGSAAARRLTSESADVGAQRLAE